TQPGFGASTSKGFNLIGNNQDAKLSATTGDQFGTPGAPIDPLLGPLQDNGGPTKTQALLTNSKAIDKGDSSGSSTDQRGFTRPIVSSTITHPGDGGDIGAFEVQPDQLTGCSEINLVVNNNADSGTGSLRSVIANACGGSTITFAPNVRGSITLTSGELLINKGLTINGPGANLLRVERSAAGGTASFRIFNVSGSFNAAISGLTIANGLSAASGGGLSSNATLRLNNVAVTGNKAQNGGGIFNSGTLTLNGSTLSGNSVSSNFVAGSGGAIFNFGATLTLINTTISGNSAIGPGGNSDSGGGIFTNIGTVSLISCTITSNSGDLAGGMRNPNGGMVTLRNTIIALNTSPGASAPDFGGTLSSLGFNLIGNGTGASITASTSGPDQIGVSAAELNLGPLQNNGGPTQTHALLTGSRAIDKGHSSSTTTDQRGLVRPLDLSSVPNAPGSDGADIGAFEFGSSFYPVTLANISTRLRVEAGDNALFAGFIITGTQDKKIIIRGIGPSLGLADQLANPILELYSGQTLLKSNDDWQNSSPADKQAIIDSTIPPTNDLESAIVATLPPSTAGYTAVLRGANNGTGIGVIQVYDLDRTVDSKLANISTRGFVSTGDNVLFAGLIVLGQGSQKVIIRALGPSTGVAGAMADAILELHDGNGGLIDSNDNWIDSPNKQAIIDSTIPPPRDAESAIVAILPGGGVNYTAIVRGVGGATGVAVVEVYALN
ncbi:MAG: hypothetical protein M3N12_04710, partial [Verrucomicrobiota bacterium]|nr:hypothetical protein [Verrucomicrobiota bacterium]